MNQYSHNCRRRRDLTVVYFRPNLQHKRHFHQSDRSHRDRNNNDDDDDDDDNGAQCSKSKAFIVQDDGQDENIRPISNDDFLAVRPKTFSADQRPKKQKASVALPKNDLRNR